MGNQLASHERGHQLRSPVDINEATYNDNIPLFQLQESESGGSQSTTDQLVSQISELKFGYNKKHGKQCINETDTNIRLPHMIACSCVASIQVQSCKHKKKGLYVVCYLAITLLNRFDKIKLIIKLKVLRTMAMCSPWQLHVGCNTCVCISLF